MNETAIGKKHWAVAEGYIPGWSHGPDPEMTSHEAVCILNTSHQDANVELTIFYTHREPTGPYRFKVPARRTLHVRLNDLQDPEPVPKATDFAFTVDSDIAIVVQHTRLDSRQSENALMTTMAFAAD